MEKIASLIFLSMMSLILACETTSQPKTTSKNISPPEPQTEVPHHVQFEPEIQKFEKEDQKDGVTRNNIFFTGSSSIRFWKTLKEDMSPLPVLNRGFGGATIPDVLHFAERYIFLHEPDVMVFYCGENDIANGATPTEVYQSFLGFVEMIENRYPKIKIIYISMKPSTARWHLWGKYEEGNQMIKQFVEKRSNIEYMNCSQFMLESDGQVRSDIFVEDGLHMNSKGYAGWTQQLKPILEKIYQR